MLASLCKFIKGSPTNIAFRNFVYLFYCCFHFNIHSAGKYHRNMVNLLEERKKNPFKFIQ